jgi:hypothetical protein
VSSENLYESGSIIGRPFGVSPGGYVGFFNPATGSNDIFTADALAQKRMRIKESLQNARPRGATRYRDLNKAVVKRAA